MPTLGSLYSWVSVIFHPLWTTGEKISYLIIAPCLPEYLVQDFLILTGFHTLLTSLFLPMGIQDIVKFKR